jgi:biofilm PGA synthesis N-glycosyltransferase PgaC
METIFWLCLLFIFYTYIGYPLLIKFLSIRSSIPVNKSLLDRDELPLISVVVTIRNESVNIEKKLTNIITQTYPQEKMEVIVVSDGSDDGSNEIIQKWVEKSANEQPVVRLVHYNKAQGKPYAVNMGVRESSGEIIILADARQSFMEDAICQLVANFNDSSIGCVSGELIFRENHSSEIDYEMGAYWRYEKWVRKTESRIGSVVGVTGSIYAIRKSLFVDMPCEVLLDDVYEPMSIALKGYRVIFDESALAIDVVSNDVSQEWKRKVRTLAGNWQLISLGGGFFSPLKNDIWWKFWSHKIFRLLVPFALLILFTTSILLDGLFYQLAASVQSAFYIMAICANYSASLRQVKLVNLSYFFIVLNSAVVIGFYYWVTGNTHMLWMPVSKKTGLNDE